MKGSHVAGGLAVSGVTVTFGGVKALADISLVIPGGTWLGLIGPNGSGKTTMLNVLSGVYRPRAGQVLLDGADISRLGAAQRGRLGIVRTFQHPQLAGSLSIEENIMLGSALGARRSSTGLATRGDRELRERARSMAVAFGCGAHLSRLPEEVPYGVRKMAELARAAASQPQVLLLDEPAAGLSREERLEVISALRDYAQSHPGVAVCLVEHDVRLVAALCSSLAVLNAGLLLASADTKTVLADERVHAAYLGQRSHRPAEAGQCLTS